MTLPPVDRRILDLLPDSGPDAPPSPVEPREDEVFVPGWEVQDSITGTGGEFRVTRISRGRPRVELRTDHAGALDHFLLGRYAPLRRSAHHLPPVLHEALPEPGAAVVVEDGPGRGATLRWSEDGREFTASTPRRDDAQLLAALLAHPLDDLVAAYLDPRSGPGLHLPG